MSKNETGVSTDAVKTLIDAAKKSNHSADALRFSQAACNCANAERALLEIKINTPYFKFKHPVDNLPDEGR